MKKLYIIPALLLLFSGLVYSQENSEEVVEVSTVEALLALVKEGKRKNKQQTLTEKLNSWQIKISKLLF